MDRDERAITLGHPSYVWREGQERRLALVRQYAPLEQARILDAGCGLGLYVQRFMAFSARVHGVDIDADNLRQARALGASDCRCPTHLFYSIERPTLETYRPLLSGGDRLESVISRQDQNLAG